jgi:hypothetical protein
MIARLGECIEFRLHNFNVLIDGAPMAIKSEVNNKGSVKLDGNIRCEVGLGIRQR